MERFLTIAEVADMFAVTQRTVRNWITEGKITAYRLGGRLIRIDPRSIDLLYEPVHFTGVRGRR